MKIVILCKKDGECESTFAITHCDEDGYSSGILATFESWSDARMFANEHILCRISECLFIDVENATIRE
jgi:hypothetical protein